MDTNRLGNRGSDLQSIEEFQMLKESNPVRWDLEDPA